jgi:hypothetical protein
MLLHLTLKLLAHQKKGAKETSYYCDHFLTLTQQVAEVELEVQED